MADADVPVYRESIGAALIDSARISVMAALEMLPAPAGPLIILPGTPHEMAEDAAASVHGCLEQAMQWLDGARVLTVAAGAPVTSLHTVSRQDDARGPVAGPIYAGASVASVHEPEGAV